MKTKQDIQAKIQALKTKLNFVLKERDSVTNTNQYIDLHKQSYEISQQIYLLEWVLEN